MIQRRMFSLVAGLFASGIIALIVADLAMTVTSKTGNLLYGLSFVGVSFILALFMFWKASGGVGLHFLGLRLISDEGGKVAFGPFLMRNAHFIGYWAIEMYRLIEYIVGDKSLTLSLGEFLKTAKEPAFVYHILYGCMALDKLMILSDFRQKSFLDRLAKVNVIKD